MPEVLRAAFRELHADRLHGFALLLTLGDRPVSIGLASDAIAAAELRLDELRHPERAAAWLRARVVRDGNGTVGTRRTRLTDPDRRQAMADLGATAATQAGLAALDHTERAALIAAEIERFGRLDTGVIVGVRGARLAELLRRARGRYANGFASAFRAAGELPTDQGPIADQVTAVAASVLR